ncbi:ANTAR domain-containing protein [Angustibacter peucedani]
MSDEYHWMDLAEEAGQLREAMAHRAPIEQAKGAIATRRQCTTDEAFAVLRKASNDHNVKLHELAVAVVELFSDYRAARHEHDASPAMSAAIDTWWAALRAEGGRPSEADSPVS